MTRFDARRWVEANEPPVFVDLDGTTFTGRLWSHLEYYRWLRVFQDWVKHPEGRDEAVYEQQLRELLDSMGFSKDAVDRMLKLPDGAFEGLVKSFFACQAAGRTPAPSPSSIMVLPPPSSNPTPNPTTGPASESPAS